MFPVLIEFWENTVFEKKAKIFHKIPGFRSYYTGEDNKNSIWILFFSFTSRRPV